MAARQLSLFYCCEMNPNKKRKTGNGNTEPESSKPRGDVEKPEETVVIAVSTEVLLGSNTAKYL